MTSVRLVSLLVGIAVALAMCAPPLRAHHNDVPGLYDTITDSTYRVIAEDADGKKLWQGTAFYIGENLLLTAGHVVDGAPHVLIGGTEVEVVDYVNDAGKGEDWAIVRLPFDEVFDGTHMTVDCAAEPQLGDEVVEFGVPAGAPLLTRGLVQVATAGPGIIYATSPPATQGASGSAVVDPTTGLVVGIHTAGWKNGEAYYLFAWPVSAVPGVCPQ